MIHGAFLYGIKGYNSTAPFVAKTQETASIKVIKVIKGYMKPTESHNPS